MKNSFLSLLLILSTQTALAAVNFIPPNCTVVSWCVLKSTPCSFMRLLHPAGLYQGESQYSVVRSGIMSCDIGYNQWQDRRFTGPVEPVVFRGEVETDAVTAQAGSDQLCSVYRTQWLAAAPACP